MATTSVFTGDTIRVQATFTNESGTLVDADGQAVTFKVYNADTRAVLTSAAATRSSTGIYFYDYTVPDTEQAYFLEMSGLFATKTQLKRTKIKAKFKVA